MIKHTPGPWKVNKRSATTITGQRSHTYQIETGKGSAIALLGCDQEGNAALIAAAPELLEALKLQMHWRMRDGSLCGCPAGKNEDEPKGKMPTLHSTACQTAREAIAKAEAP